MKTKLFYMLLFLTFNTWAGGEAPMALNHSDLTSGQANLLKHPFISSGSSHSSGGGFRITVSVAEPVTGRMNDTTEIIQINTGFIKPNTDLIFINSLEQE